MGEEICIIKICEEEGVVEINDNSREKESEKVKWRTRDLLIGIDK